MLETLQPLRNYGLYPNRILDFRFWIEKPSLVMGYVNPSVAIIFQIGVRWYQKNLIFKN